MSRRPAPMLALAAAAVLLLLAAAAPAAAARPDPASPQARAPQPPRAVRVLALGDSITQGSVPSANLNHPYTLELKKRLEAAGVAKKVDVVNAAVGGAGVYAVGFHNPTTLVPFAREQIAKTRPDWVVALIGINDLLREGRTADDVMRGLKEIYERALKSGASVLAIAPLPAPGFVSRSDYKEAERLKLAGEIEAFAKEWNGAHPKGPKVATADLGVHGPMDFWRMGDAERREWLDDGLHLTQAAYDRMGGFIADALLPKLAKP